MLEQRALLASLTLINAEVRPDGRTVQLEFTAPLPSSHAVPDWMPGDLAGTRLTTGSGVVLEQIGTVVATTDGLLRWSSSYLIQNPNDIVTFGSGSVLVSAGEGLLQDTSGNITTSFTDYVVANRSLVDADGFTTERFERGVGGVTLYVSSTYGSDTRSFAEAQNPATPYQSPVQAMKMLKSEGKHGTGSAVRLLRGDTFGPGMQIRIGGQDEAHPLVIEDYWYKYTSTSVDPGTRPVIRSTTDSHGITSHAWGAPDTPASIDHVVIRRLAVTTSYVNPSSVGMYLLRGGSNWTLDDLEVSKFKNGIVFQGEDGPFNQATILRSTIKDSWTTAPRPQGSFIHKTYKLLISQSTYDSNGRTNEAGTGRDIYSHNIYITDACGPALVWGNVIRAAGSHGIQMRSGGVLAYNYLSRNAIAADVPSAGGSQYKNVVEKAEDISSSLLRGYGLTASNGYGPGSTQVIEFNVIVNSVATNIYRGALNLTQNGVDGTHSGRVRHNTVVNAGMIKIEGGGPTPAHKDIEYSNNIFDTKSQRLISATSYDSWDWYRSDNNVLASIAALPVATDGANQTLDYWKADSGGTEANSITQIPTYLNETADIGDYYLETGGTNSETAFINLLRGRGIGVWDARFDIMKVFAYFAQAYRSTNLPAEGEGKFNFYGTSKFEGLSPLNASFESPALAAGSYRYNPDGTWWTFTPKSTTGGSGIASNGSGFTSGNPAAPKGVQVAFLQGKGTMSQTVGGWSAGDYVLNFASARRSGLAQQDFQVLVDGVAVGTFVPTTTAYSRYTTARFTVAAGSHKVEFRGLNSAGGDATALIDDFRIEQVTEAPPSAPAVQSLPDAGLESASLGTAKHIYSPAGTPWLFSTRSGTSGGGVAANGSPLAGSNAPEGVQAAFLQGKGTMSQSVGGWSAGDYVLNFASARRNGMAQQDFQVLVDGVLVGTFVPTTITYARFTTARFTVAAGAHKIEFRGLNSAGGDATANIDDIRIERA